MSLHYLNTSLYPKFTIETELSDCDATTSFSIASVWAPLEVGKERPSLEIN